MKSIKLFSIGLFFSSFFCAQSFCNEKVEISQDIKDTLMIMQRQKNIIRCINIENFEKYKSNKSEILKTLSQDPTYENMSEEEIREALKKDRIYACIDHAKNIDFFIIRNEQAGAKFQ